MSKNQILERQEKNNMEIEESSGHIESNNKVKNKQGKNKVFIITVVMSIIIITLLVLSCVFAIINKNSNTIINGIKINGIEVSKMTKDNAKQKINEEITKLLEEQVILKYQDYEIGIDTKQINAEFNVDEIVDKAYQVGRSNNIFSNNYDILKYKFEEANMKLTLKINEESWNKLIENLNGNLPGGIEQSSYYIDNNKLIITKGKEGVVSNSEKLKELVLSKIESFGKESHYIEIPVEIKSPSAINIEAIYNEVHKDSTDAYISKEPFEIHPHVNGIDFGVSVDEAKRKLEESENECVIPLKVIKPSKTTDMLGEEAFPDRLATYSTKYDSSNYNRTTNLRLSASKINGVVLMPGEEFSYNRTLGQRTAAAGYKPAASYVGGKVVNEYGGGICQTSSTLYNTVLLANLEVTSRSNHCYVSSYVPISRDATVSWGTLDFKFKNNRKYPIKIRAYASNGVVKVDILGVKQDDDYEVAIESKVTSSIKYSTQYEEDSNLEEGKEKVTQNGSNGSIGEAYKVLKKNGKVVSRTLISRDRYSAKPQIIVKGTKKVNNSNNINNSDSNNNNGNSNNSTSVTIENVDMTTVKNQINNDLAHNKNNIVDNGNSNKNEM
ncbi:MAG: VanW family protein [Clostridia bacterium]|nr:VanW family protein [Clostridia bacterium]